MAGSNCIGPSAPAALAPLCTPGSVDCPLSDSTCRWRPGPSRASPGRWPRPPRRGRAWPAGPCRSPRSPPAVPPGVPRQRQARPAPRDRRTRRPPRPRRAEYAGHEDEPERRPQRPSSDDGEVRLGRGVRVPGQRPWQGTVGSAHSWARQWRARHTWAMKSTMQDAPLLISDILRHGQQVHGDSTVITVEEGGHRVRHLRRGGRPGREAGGRPDPAGRRAGRPGRHLLLEQPGPPGGVPGHSLPWGRCCTRSTSGSPPTSWPTSSTTPRTAASSSTPRSSRCWPPSRTTSRPSRRSSSWGRATPRPSARPSPTSGCWPPRSRASTGPSSTSAPPRPCVTRAGPPATPRASCTRTAPPGCTPWPSRRPPRSA